LEEDAAQEVATGVAAEVRGPELAGAVAAVLRAGARPLLELALLVGLAEHAGEAVPALRVALVLEDLEERLHLRAELGLRALLLGRGRAGILDEEHVAVALVRVVRDREHVAAVPGVEARRLELAPEALRRRLLEVRRGEGHALVLEDDVAMHRARAGR